MKKVFGAILWLMFLAITAGIAKDLARKAMEPSVEEQLKEISNKINKKLPVKLDQYTVLESTSVGPGRTFTYKYRLNQEALINIINGEKNLKNNVCNGELSVWLKKEVQIVYSYNINDRFFNIPIKYSDCV